MSAIETIQTFLDLFESPSYLEIGVSEGLTLHGLRARRKVGVDPAFKFDLETARRRNLNTHYHAVPSDDFFAGYNGAPFDVAYIDGLHTSEQTLRDLMNVVANTHASSIIIIDDVFPDSYASSLPDNLQSIALKAALGDPGLAWMGDVYRLIYFVATFMQAYSYASPPSDNARLVMWRQVRPAVPRRTIAEVGAVDFATLCKDRSVLNARPLGEIVAMARAAGAGDGATAVEPRAISA